MTVVLHVCTAAFTCDQALVSSRWPLPEFSSEISISTDADHAQSVYAADLDGDGDMDVLSASFWDDKIAWYRNEDGAGTFSSEIIISTDADHAASVYAADLDGDGDLDVLSASNKIVWYRNMDGAGTFSSQIIISTADWAHSSVYAADFDGDGDMDVLSASHSADKIAWYRNEDGAGTFSSQIIISTAADGAMLVYAADIDGDGDLDVLSVSEYDDKIAWYRNTDGEGTFSSQIIISTAADGGRSVYAADMDGDGDLDVLSASFWDGKIAWYRNEDGAGMFSSQIIISTAANLAISVYAADLDGDGDMDVLSASRGDDKIAWYRNMDGAGTFSSQIIISTTADLAASVYAADLDGDGDMDVLSASVYYDKIAWYRNMAKADVDVSLHFLGANYTHYTNASPVNQTALQYAVQTDVLAAVPNPTLVWAVFQSVSDGSTPGRAAMELEVEVVWESVVDVVTDASSWVFDNTATVINEHWCDTPPCTVVVLATPSPSQTPSASATPSTTPSASATPSQTPSQTPSTTPSPSATPSATDTPSTTPTPSPRPWCDLEASPSLRSTPVTIIHHVTIPGGSYSRYTAAPGPDRDEFRCAVMTDAMLAVPDSTRVVPSVAVTGGNDTSLHLELTTSWFSPADVPTSVSWSFPSASAALLSFGWCEAASCPVTVVPSSTPSPTQTPTPSVTPSPAVPSTDTPTVVIVAASVAVAVCLALGITGTVYAIRRHRSRTAKQTQDHPPKSPTSASSPPVIHVTSLASQEPDLPSTEAQKPGAPSGPPVVAPATSSGLPPPQYAAEAPPPGYTEGEEPSSAAPPAYSDDDDHVPAVL